LQELVDFALEWSKRVTSVLAAVSLNRNFIGMELDNNYFKIAEERMKKASSK
jgi:DNA modification methylase